eukprot:15314813-Heterocapsa_arctica.AAC.1
MRSEDVAEQPEGNLNGNSLLAETAASIVIDKLERLDKNINEAFVVLDSACSREVGGREWYEDIKEKLKKLDRE